MAPWISAAVLVGVIGGAIKAAHLVTERRQHNQAMTRLFAPYSHVRTINREGET
jgi:hypothetical protein